jgi:RHS repeat-associated protein
VDYYYSSVTHTNHNSFQLVLINRSDIGQGDFDIEFNYDQIQWEAGQASGGNYNGLGGYSAHVGYSNGSGKPGTSFEMPGSGVPGSFLDSNGATGLIRNSLNSSGVQGRYVFPVRSDFLVNVVAPPSLTSTDPAVVTVQYRNTGLIPMPAPVLQLTASQNGNLGAFLTLDPTLINVGHNTNTTPTHFAPAVEMLASGDTPGVLQPGESGAVAVYYGGWLSSGWNAASPGVAFTVGVLFGNNTTAIDWPSMESSMQPPGVPNSAWPAVFANLTTQLGPTWGSYVQRLDSDAAYLGSLGQNPTDVNELWALEMEAANGFGPAPNLANNVDISVPAPGLPLSLGRSFSANVIPRNILGPFGYGWALGGAWGQTLTVQNNGDVAITQADGSQLLFTQAAGGGYEPPVGSYDTLANLGNGVFTLTRLNGLVTQFLNGQVSYLQDANGNRISTGYTNGLLTSLIDSSGQWIGLSYNTAGRVVAVTDSTGQATVYTYDVTNQYLVSVTQYVSATDTVGYTTSYSYNTGTGTLQLAHTLTSITNPDGTQQLFSYDSAGLLGQTSTIGGAQATTYAYGSGGQLTVTDADGVATVYSYDARGLLANLTTALGTTSFTYDTNGNLLQQIDPTGQTSAYVYNGQGQMLQSTDAAGNVTQLTYGPLNTVTSVTDPNSNTTAYSYNANGDQTSIVYADGAIEQRAFNPIGELLQSTDANGNVTNYTYNTAGQILTEAFSDGTQKTLVYDQYGNLVSATDSSGTTSLSYDSSNRLTQIVYSDGSYLQYTYDSAGRRLTMKDQTGYTVNYSYNSLGQLSGLSDGSGAIVSYTYDSAGRLSQALKGNGTYTNYTYDAAGNIASVVNYASNGILNSSFVYTYDQRGLRSSLMTVDGQWVYTYDATGQLTHAVFTPNATNPDGLTAQDLQYFYDHAGNRTESIANGVVTTYTGNARNEYTTTTTAGVTTADQYDPNGNLISQATGGALTTYTFNVQNQLVGIQTPNRLNAAYQLNVFGVRSASTVNGQQTRLLIDPSSQNVVGQFSSTGALLTHFTNALGLVSQVNPFGVGTYYDFDALGSTAGLTSATGSYVTTYNYLPFGSTVTSNGAVTNPFQFVGEWGVSNVGQGIYMMGMRTADVNTGRFISEDPAGSDTNSYRYALNQPTQRIDPAGLWSVTFGVSLHLGVGGEISLSFGSTGVYWSRGVGFGLDASVSAVVGRSATISTGQQTNVTLGPISVTADDQGLSGVGVGGGAPVGASVDNVSTDRLWGSGPTPAGNAPDPNYSMELPSPNWGLDETSTPPVDATAQQDGVNQADMSPSSTDPVTDSSYDTNNANDTYWQTDIRWGPDGSLLSTNTDNTGGGTTTTDTAYDPNGNVTGGNGPAGDPLHYYVGADASGQELAGPPTAPGTYTFVATDQLGNVLYSGTFHVPQAFGSTSIAPTISVSDGGTYNGQPFIGQVSLTGVDGQAHAGLEGIRPRLTYYNGTNPSGAGSSQAPIHPGTYTVVASFPGSADYSSATAEATFVISPATPVLSVSDGGGVYNGSGFPVAALIAGVSGQASTSLEGVGLVATYYAGTSATGTPLSGVPSNAGTYTVAVSFGGSADYASASAATTFVIAPASPAIMNVLVGGNAYALSPLGSFNLSNGALPYGGLVMDANGNLYGTTSSGGAYGYGVVFEIVSGSGTLTTLASFNGSNGAYSYAGLVVDGSGNLYGTTSSGGAYGYGTVFEVVNGSGTITTLASFNGNNGAYSYAGLVVDGSGNLYGTTSSGGLDGYGTVFEVANGSNTITALASFTGSNGGYSYGGLVMDGSNNLYGTTSFGGANGYGTVFEVANGSGTITALASFDGSNGEYSYAGMVMDGMGNLYGTTSFGGANGYGTVFEVANGSGAISSLASFSGTNGAYSNAGLVMDGTGNLYGTTPSGGANGYGTVFELANGSSSITALVSFNGSNGAYSYAGLVIDASGNFYGTTAGGGTDSDGMVFELTHPVITYGTPLMSVIGTLNGGTASIPVGELVSVTLNGTTLMSPVDANGNFAVTFNTSTLSASSLPYSVIISYAGDGNFAAATAGIPLSVVHGPATSTISVGTNALNLGTTIAGTAGSFVSYTISGSNLTAGIIITAPSGVEISSDGGSTWSSSLTLYPVSGSLASTTIDVRIASSAAVGSLSGTITDSSSGAAEQDISLSGTVLSNAATHLAVSAILSSTAGSTFSVTVTA